jgi:hypothetical protein
MCETSRVYDDTTVYKQYKQGGVDRKYPVLRTNQLIGLLIKIWLWAWLGTVRYSARCDARYESRAALLLIKREFAHASSSFSERSGHYYGRCQKNGKAVNDNQPSRRNKKQQAAVKAALLLTLLV